MFSLTSFSTFFKLGRLGALVLLAFLVSNCQTMVTSNDYGYIRHTENNTQLKPERVLPNFSSFLEHSLRGGQNIDEKDLRFRKSGLSHHANQMKKLHHHQWVTRLSQYVDAALPAIESYGDYQLVASGYTLNLASFFENELKNFQKIDSYESYVLFLSQVNSLKRNKKILAAI